LRFLVVKILQQVPLLICRSGAFALAGGFFEGLLGPPVGILQIFPGEKLGDGEDLQPGEAEVRKFFRHVKPGGGVRPQSGRTHRFAPTKMPNNFERKIWDIILGSGFFAGHAVIREFLGQEGS
jgi:hypothetical protein